MASADVVVIGGGVNGASTAFQLAKAGVRNVVLLERRQLGAGASGKSGALVRMHYTNPTESKLAFESLKIFQNWSDLVGGDPGFNPTGFVQVVAPAYEQQLRANVADQQAIGINTRIISPSDLKELVPEARVDDLSCAAYEPDTGFADPNATLYAFAQAAKRLGVDVRTGVEATRIVVEQDRVVGVETTDGRIDTETVVAAPGAWADRLLRPLGLDFGLKPHRVQVAVFRWPLGFTSPHPVFIDSTQGSWFRCEGTSGTLVGVELGVDEANIDQLDEGVDEDYVNGCRRALAARMPIFEHATMRGGWAGIITMSPDDRPIIDQIPSITGLFCMIGDSGTSFKTSPAIGKCLAEWITVGEPQTVDLSPFRSTRFAEGKPWVDENAYGENQLTISR
jgi:sarcosine oxidase subunit beta